MRKIHIDGKEWLYNIGRSILIVNPQGIKFSIGLCQFSGLDPDVIDKAIRKRYFKIFPSEIKEYIIKNLKEMQCQQPKVKHWQKRLKKPSLKQQKIAHTMS